MNSATQEKGVFLPWPVGVCGIKGFLPTSVIQGNPPLYEENSVWEAVSVVSQKWSFPTALPPGVWYARNPKNRLEVRLRGRARARAGAPGLAPGAALWCAGAGAGAGAAVPRGQGLEPRTGEFGTGLPRIGALSHPFFLGGRGPLRLTTE